MELHKKEKKQSKKAPRVPIKTYKWEDIRRARLRGGYPWTYLYKKPFNEKIDPTLFKMEAIPKSKSSSALEKSNEYLEIKEITNGKEGSLTPEPSGYIVITEIPSDSENHSKSKERGSLTIEDMEEPEVLNLESAESSDNISQYLDKEETAAVPESTNVTSESEQKPRAKSEEPKRKRKLSIDSGYSRKSLSKLGIIKKLKEARDKIKVPKLKLLHSQEKPTVKKEQSKSKETKSLTRPINENPVYIHIPLKPPDGETDEFSYLEFGEKKPEIIEPPKIVEETLKEPPADNDQRRPSSNPDEIVAFEILKSETLNLPENTRNGLHGSNILIIQKDDDTKNDDVFIIMPDEEPSISCSDTNLARHSRHNSRKARAKSAEPERKRKLSIESSNSRMSLSKLGLLKKLKDAKEKLKFPKTVHSRSNSKKNQAKKVAKKETTVKTEVKKESKKETSNEPKYIHIPLKPPPGETDEFSYLEFEEEEKTETKEEPQEEPQPKKEIKEQNSIDSPGSTQNEGVHFIFLTPPSDDEILDRPDIPETPSDKIKELKEIAKEALNGAKKKHNEDEKMVVDEEDGLKLTQQEQDLKSSLKSESSPILKKKVSFKRRSRDDSKNGDYEEVQTSKNEKFVEVEMSQSMSVDEEKSYLDDKKIIKDTSLEEDYNRWSKLSDHEYEPVNPPPDNVSPPVVDQQQKPISTASSTTSLERRMLGAEETKPDETFTVEEMQTQIESKFFSKPTQLPTTTTTTTATITTEKPPTTKPPKSETTGKIQQAIKTQAGKLKTKFHTLKKPNIKLPSKEKLPKFKIDLPKIPDTTKINLPKFSLPRRNPKKRSLKERHLSTESNAGDSKKNYFDFRTYPRLFKKKKQKNESFDVPEFATVPRTKSKHKSMESEDKWDVRDTIRIPLHSEDSMEDDNPNNREDSVERRMASHIRYDADIDIDDAYERENQEIHTASPFSHDYNNRWQHGSFHPEPNLDLENTRNQQITDLDSPGDGPNGFEMTTNKDIHSSESSLGIHRRGVLEEIDSDEFFLRQKGISQDNIEVGMYLSSEIREAFKSPVNALAEMQKDFSSNQSLPETQSAKRKAIKKPKRKKTPHVSQEQIDYDQDSEMELMEAPPSRPKRRSKRNKKQKEEEKVIPYQETSKVEESENKLLYENEQMQGKEQPDIKIDDPYANFKYESDDEVFVEDNEKPTAPPRKQRSLKSLNYSEHDSIMADFPLDKEPPAQEIEVYKIEHEYIIPTPDLPPMKPVRSGSRSSSKSRDHEEVPIRPMRTRSNSRTRSVTNEPAPCLEEPCVQDFRDYMGYAVIDKQQKREPPLPPPPRRKRSEQKFFTVPRPLNDEPPMRPLRNYSTLGPSRPPRRKPPPNMTDEEKENIDIIQYIEIEDEMNRDLHSGEVIQKMKDRPLPAPPRPPRKSRAFQDITSQDNINEDLNVEEAEVSTQTDDYVCEEADKSEVDALSVERHLITPTHYSYDEETITHGSLVIEPLNGAKILPDHELTVPEKSEEHTIPISKDYEEEPDNEETSEIPEEFTKLKDPPPTNQPQIVERIIEKPIIIQPDSNSEVEVLRAHKLQVSDLDVDRLSVNELLASKIIVSEIDSGNIQTNEIHSKSGALKVGEIELPPSVVQQLFEKLQSAVQEQAEIKPEAEESGQKKTPIEQTHRKNSLEEEVVEIPIETDSFKIVEAPPEPPIRIDSTITEEIPQRPPRQAEKLKLEEPEVDEEPPPRPPEPQIDYLHSQPPTSFYALRAQQYIDSFEGDIPMAPRRRRPHKPPKSSSDDDDSPAPAPSRRRYRSPEEPSIPQLTGQLIQACSSAANSSLKRLIAHITNNLLRNADGQQDMHVMMVMLVILIAGLILLGCGDEKTVHHHHWEYFNPPRDM